MSAFSSRARENTHVLAVLPTFPDSERDSHNWMHSPSFQIPVREAYAPSSTATHSTAAPSGAGSAAQSYISNTELADGRQALLIDPGSFNNLAGMPRIKRTATLGYKVGKKCDQRERRDPFHVAGIGREAQAARVSGELSQVRYGL